MNNIILLIILLFIIYLIDKQIFESKMLILYFSIILLWKFSIHTENFNDYIKRKKIL